MTSQRDNETAKEIPQAHNCQTSVWLPTVSLSISLADAEITEDQVEEVFDIDGAGNPAEPAQGEAEVFGTQFGEVGGEGTAQGGGRSFQRLAMAGAGQGRHL